MRKHYIVYLVSIAAFFGPFMQTFYTPLLPEVAELFRTSSTAVSLTISVYPIIFAFMQLIYGPLIDKYGRRKILLLGFLFYLLATLGVSLSYHIEMLIVFRILQAVGGSVGSVAALTVIGDLFEGNRRVRAMGIYQMLVALGPGLGPVFGGYVGERFGFHPLLWVMLAISTLYWLVIYISLPETGMNKVAGERFALRQFSDVLAHRSGQSVILLGIMQYTVFYILIILLPSIATDAYRLSPTETGVLYLPVSICLIIGSIVCGSVQVYIEIRRMLIATAVLNGVSVLLLAMLSPVSLTWLVVCISFFGFSLGLSLPLQTALLSSELSRMRATATGVYNFFRYQGMTIGPVLGAYFYPFGYSSSFLVLFIIYALVIVIISSRVTSAQRACASAN
ncbi:multidrug resistance protein [Paenibacillus mucilaginosus]|uniref:MFS transporter n=1 Tax=Paenibacillus mucilaginosus TaxID=61624 RepID=UPI003D1A3D93